MTFRDPEPLVVPMAPTSVVMCRPGPHVVANPRPAVGSNRFPVAVVVRTPADVDDRIPDVAVIRLVAPRAVPIEVAAVQPQLARQILRGSCGPEARVASHGRPPIEGIEARGVERLRVRRRSEEHT